MKNYVRIGMIVSLGLALQPAQTLLTDPCALAKTAVQAQLASQGSSSASRSSAKTQKTTASETTAPTLLDEALAIDAYREAAAEWALDHQSANSGSARSVSAENAALQPRKVTDTSALALYASPDKDYVIMGPAADGQIQKPDSGKKQTDTSDSASNDFAEESESESEPASAAKSETGSTQEAESESESTKTTTAKSETNQDQTSKPDSASAESSAAKSETNPEQTSMSESESEPAAVATAQSDSSSASGSALESESESETEVMNLVLSKEELQRQQEQIEQIRELLDSQLIALNSFRTDDADPFSGRWSVGSKLPGPGSSAHQTKKTQSETETEMETETETETEIPEETETEFHPVEMGSSIPDTGQSTMDETETENTDGNSPETEDSSDDSGEDETESTGSGPVSRHGVFAVPQIEGLNEARINLYDYYMLREYPLSRLPKDLHLLKRELEAQTSEYEGTWSVFVQNLTTGQIMILNDTPMRSASVMKLFIMGTVYEAFDHGDLPRNEDTVYLLRNMITNSSNEASNKLLALLGDGDLAAGVAKVNEFIRLRGYSSGTVEYNGFQDSAAIVDPNHANVITAKDVGLLLYRVYNRSFLSRRVCNEIEQMMLDQATRYKIPRGLPEGVQCGNKSGETSSIANDAAVIYGPTTDYILVVLSNDWSSENAANEQVEEVSRTVYHFFEG